MPVGMDQTEALIVFISLSPILMGSMNALNHFLALRFLDEQWRVQLIYEYNIRAF